MSTDQGNANHLLVYYIRVKGHLVGDWSAWLEGSVIWLTRDNAHTSIEVAVPDQAALRGVLNKLWDLNLTLISVSQYRETYDG